MALKITIPEGVTALAVHGLRQWDYGQTLEIHDTTLPAEIEVHFAHVGLREAVVRECNVVGGVATAEIPDVLLEQDKPLTAWIYEKDGESGETTKAITLHIEARAKPLATDEVKLLHVNVVDKIAVYRNRDGDIVCGNADYKIQFTFGEAWEGVTDKVARFVWNGQYFDKPIDENGVAEVPVIMSTNQVLVGVYSETMRTTTSAAIGCRTSILCKTDVPHPSHGQGYSEHAKKAAADAAAAAASAAESAEVVAAKEGLTANALKGHASGELVTLADVSPIGHNMLVKVSGVEDVGSVKVLQQGKNLCNIASITSEENVAGEIKLHDIKKHGTYTASADITLFEDDGAKNPSLQLMAFYTDGTYTTNYYGSGLLKDGVARRVSTTITTDTTKTIRYFRILALNYTTNNGRHAKAENIQLEKDAATEYEPYIAPIALDVNADGSVDGVASLYPSTTIMTDTAGAVVDVTYNRDINKAFLELQKMILEMGV